MSNFALVIQLNIPIDKETFRIIILSKFHSYTTHYRLKNLTASAYRTIATVLSSIQGLLGAWCRICGDEKSLLVMTIWFFETFIIFA